MLKKCEFRPARDVGKVIEGLAPDIDKMIETHQVVDTTGEVVYNGITELKDCGFAVDDVFEALMISRGYANVLNQSSPEGSQGPLMVSE